VVATATGRGPVGGEQRWECYHGNRGSAFLTWVGDAAVLTSNYLPGVEGFRHSVPEMPM